MKTLRICNWDKWQSCRSDRGAPPWIKVHRRLMSDLAWMDMSDAQRGQLVAIWLLAADRDGVIPASSKLIQKMCGMESEPDLNFFISQGFIEPDANVTPERRQPDANLTHQSRGEQSKSEESRAEADGAGAPAPAGKDFAFSGKFVKGLSEAELNDWLQANSSFTREGMLAELARCDEYYGGRGYTGKKPSNWIITTRAWIERTHKRATENGVTAKDRVLPSGRVLSDVEIAAYKGCI